MRPVKHWILTLTILFFCSVAFAGTISVEWDPVDGATGYRVYYALESGAYNDADYVQVGNLPQATLDNLQDCTEYFLAVKAFNSGGALDQFSNEISGWARPVITTTDVTVATQGDQLVLELDGANFMSGADLVIDNPGLFVDSVSIPGCNRLLASLTIEPTSEGVRPAEIGIYSVAVNNPDHVFGESSPILEVLINPARFDIYRGEDSSDGRIDGQDTIWLGRLFGTREPAALYNPDLDMDGDGWIDGNDLSHLASAFGECWSDSGWSLASCPEGR
jgi:hypothetical protein